MADKTTAVSVSTAKKSLPPIGVLFADSWELLKLSWKKLLIFTLIMAGIGVLFVVVLVLILAVSVGGGIYAFSHGGFSPASIGAIGIGLVIGVLLLLAGAIILGSLSQAGWILSVSDSKLTIEQILKKGLHLVLPLFALSLLTFLLALPAFFLFLIPGLFVIFFLYFGPYSIVLSNRGILDSLRRSIYLVRINFWAMAVRALLMIGLFIAVSFIFSLTTGLAGVKVPLIGILFVILKNVVNILLGWFVISYSVTLYKQAEAASPDKEGRGKLLWFVITAILGVVFVVLLLGTIVKALTSNPEIKNAIMSGAATSNSSGLGSGNSAKAAYKNAFVQSCEQGGTASKSFCTCIADNLIDKYSTQELQAIIKKYADTKVVPQELTSAAKVCSPSVTQ